MPESATLRRVPPLLLILRVAVLVVVAAIFATIEAFHVAARPFGTTLPVAASAAVAGNLLLGRLGALATGRSWGAALPGLAWLAVALALASARPEGDIVITNTGRGLSFLVAGTAAAAIAVGISAGSRPAEASPSG